MMLRALSSDWLKIKGKGIWLLAIIAPVGLIAMQALNFGLRYDYLMKAYASDPWGGLIENILMFVPIALFLGATLISSLMANVENQLSSWKQLLALPISRTAVFSAKFTLAVLILLVSCALLSVGTAVLGLALQLSWSEMPVIDVIRLGFAPFLASLPMLALQLWLSLTAKNQGLPISIGLTIAILSMFTMKLHDLIPLKWPLLAYLGPDQGKAIGAGVLVGAVIIMIGLIHFNRRDVE